MSGYGTFKSVIDAIHGTAGIPTWPAAAAAGNGVSMAEVLRYIEDALLGTNGVVTFPASAKPANGVSLAEVLREIYDQSEKAEATSAAIISNGLNLFTIAGGPIEVLALHSKCVTANDATASTLQYTHDPTDGAATTISAASASLANAAAGASVTWLGTDLTTAPTVTANGAVLSATRQQILQAGTIAAVVGVGSTTGTWTHHVRYRPLARGVTVTAAF